MKPKTTAAKPRPSFRRKPLVWMAASLFGLSLPLLAQAVEVDYRLKASLAGITDAGRDLDLEDVDSSTEGYLDVTPWLHLQFSENWAAFARVRGFAPSGTLLTPGNDNNNVGATDEAFVALREAWIEYGGITSYPGEVLRVGRQRIRNDDAQSFDQDIDAVRWIVDTTLLDSEFGAARQFDSYRTDDAEIARQQKDRTYYFGHLAYDWAARQRVGVRVVHARDDDGRPEVGDALDPTRRNTRGQQTWFGVYFDNHAYDWRPIQPQGEAVSYWASANLLRGKRDRIIADDPILLPPADVVAGTEKENLKAWAADVGVRARVAGPVQIGAAYAYSSGGEAGEGRHQYEQSGLQSNYSRFTGTRAQIYRYNEAYRPELGNLQVASAFASLSEAGYDTSLIYSRLRRSEADGAVTSDGLIVSPTQDSRDLGEGVDLVASRYFSIGRLLTDVPEYTPSEDVNSSLRLRASWFKPGDAYGDDAKDEYRAMLELTLWY